MIVVQLRGGLGNQLFQYATGRALALKTGSELRLDLGQLRTERYRPFRLACFRLAARPARKRDVPFEFRQPYRSRAARKVVERLPPRIVRSLPGGPRVIRENRGAPHNALAPVRDDVYLVGFWQSPRYFEDAEATIRADLSLTAERVGVSADLANQVGEEGTVSVHVRRGDYVGNPFFSPCSADYYRHALELLASRVEVRKVYVFSDDIGWARQELDFQTPTVFASESMSDSDMGDFFLMSRCQHHIIANSSFSWWAAWLGRRPHGQVVAPAHWFNDPAADDGTLRPPGWLVV
jgi:hypothetical protein